ncbi:MAG: DUF2254 family protein [Cyanobacteriota bacterium]|nr:DUF2254 family protein [Cyanobacteriota bacterium]
MEGIPITIEEQTFLWDPDVPSPSSLPLPWNPKPISKLGIPMIGGLMGLGLVILLVGLLFLGSDLKRMVSGARIEDTEALQGFIGTLAQVLSGVLGFTISVVAIVVQLSADRFTPKVTELFLREKINFFIILFLIVSTLTAVWTALVFSVVAKPILLIWLNLILGTLSFLVLIPYFIFVFNFLRPTSIIDRIEQQTRQSIINAFRYRLDQPIQEVHQQCLSALDEIKGIAASAIRQRENLIMLDSLDSLKTFFLFYGTYKHKLPHHWFLLTPAVCRDPDFVSVDLAHLREIETEKIWVELKIFRQYQAIFNESLNELREACYIISINTREIADRAFQSQKDEIINLSIKFFNTYLRAVINTKDIRTGYNILKQYRLLAESALLNRRHSIVLDIAQYFRYYSLIAYKAGLFFLSETFAFDLCLLAQLCNYHQSEIGVKLLEILLKIDQDSEGEQQEITLQGIRKSQVKLAACYLQTGQPELAQLIYHDMQHEPRHRLRTIHYELRSTKADFWEFTDRGENFYYVEAELQPFVDQFFTWFDWQTESHQVGDPHP